MSPGNDLGKGGSAAGATRDRISAAVADPLGALGLDLEAVELTPAGKRRVLRVAVDRDGGVTLDDIAEATREVSRAIDEADAMGESPYTLEVTTVEGETLTGRIGTSDDDRVVLEISGEPRTLGYGEVAKALVQIEFNRKQTDGEA